MNVANLADGSALGNAAIAILVTVFTLAFPAIALAFWWMFRQPKFRGPALSATAQVLTLRRIGSMMQNSLVPQIMCRIGLRVAVPGHEPYEVKIWKGWAPWAMGDIQPGSTVAVEVDSTNPKKVRIDSGFRSTQQVRFAGTNAPAAGAGIDGVRSAADLLASGQRIAGALKSFAPQGTTPRSLGRTPSRPDLLDATHYALVIELHFPNLAPIEARTVQPVPLDQVANLAIGLALPCAVEPTNPQVCVVDWDAITN